MIDFIFTHPAAQALIATLFTYGITAAGAAVVFFFKKVNQLVLNAMLGFGAGVMIAGAFWSLLTPAIELSQKMGSNGYFLPSIGFLTGGIFVVLAEKFLDKYSEKFFADIDNREGAKRSLLLITAIMLHNVPEGMAIGVAFCGASVAIPGCSVIGAALLALGIGLQNFPEGAAVALPLRREGLSRKKAFFWGQLSGIVEPISAVIGVYAALAIQSIQPFLLAFSAGSMIAVVSAELIPESAKEHKNLCAIGVILGFILMMILNVALD